MSLTAHHLAMSYLIDEHLTAIRAAGASTATIRDRARCLRRLHDDLPYGLMYACREQLEAWLTYDRWSLATRYTYTGHILGFYRWLASTGRIQTDPTIGMKRPRVPRKVLRPASDAQTAAALSAPEPIRTAAMLALYGGLRRSEIAACHREHITERTIFIPRAKGGDAQTVPTHPAIWAHVRDMHLGPLIVDEHGQELGPERLSGRVIKWFRRQGFPGFGLHSLRRRFGRQVQRQHGNIRVTQRALRHATVTTTELYTWVGDDEVSAAVTSLPTFGDGTAPACS